MVYSRRIWWVREGNPAERAPSRGDWALPLRGSYRSEQALGRAIFAAGLSILLAGLGHFFLGQGRGLGFAVPSAVLLYLHFSGLWEFADVAFLALGVFSAFDAFSFAQRGYGIF